MKWYNKRNAVVVPFKVRKDGMDGRGRNRYRKTWLLKNVMFTLATESPSPAPTPHYILCPWAFGTLWIDPKTSKIGRNGALDLVILH